MHVLHYQTLRCALVPLTFQGVFFYLDPLLNVLFVVKVLKGNAIDVSFITNILSNTDVTLKMKFITLYSLFEHQYNFSCMILFCIYSHMLVIMFLVILGLSWVFRI